MGLLEQTNEQDKTAIRKINRIIANLNRTYSDTYFENKDKSFLQYLISVVKNPMATSIQPLLLFADTLEIITSNKTNYNIATYMEGMQKAEEIYLKMFPYGPKTPDFSVQALVFLNFFRVDGPAVTGLLNSTLMSTFQNKHNYIDFMSTISNDRKAASCLDDITQYGLSVRAFFIDDETYTANMKQVAAKMLKSANRADIIREETKRVEHMAGIYDIDEADVAKTEQQLAKANSMLKNTMDILEQADRKTEQLNRIMKDTTETIQEISKRETDFLSMKAISAREDLNAAYNSFLDTQRQEVILQKDVLLGQIFNEAETKLNELRTMARTITASANTELLRINTETTNAIDKIQNYVSNDQELQKLLTTADENKELFDKIAKLEFLNTQNIEMLTRGLEAQLAAQGNTTETAERTQASSASLQTPMQVVVADAADSNAESAALPPMETAPAAIPGVNLFLDTSIPFEERFKLVMDEKQKRIAKGEHFHVMFDDVLTVLMEDANPYLIGPSGCGKTFMVRQIASLLNLDFIDIGYINEEYDILGFQTATGAYSTSNFYRCYKYGKIAFCDELDNGNSRATVKLNSFLSNNKNARYSFPHGENVKRHENFRIIAAGNTAGNGADANYNTREKIEESVQQRFTPIYVSYDNEVEKKILGDYKDWYQFIVLFRKATDAWGNLNDCSAPGILTTRDAARIKRYLNNKSLNMGKILDYEFIQTKDMEYLAFLSKHMGDRLASYPEAKEIYTLFDKKVKALREKGGLR